MFTCGALPSWWLAVEASSWIKSWREVEDEDEDEDEDEEVSERG